MATGGPICGSIGGPGGRIRPAFSPSRPVELLVHSAPGGGSDVFAKALVEIAEKEKLLAQPLRVTNHTAGASVAAMEYLVAKKDDAHTKDVYADRAPRARADHRRGARRGALQDGRRLRGRCEEMAGLLIMSATGSKWAFISEPAVKDRMTNLIAGKGDIVIPQPQDANEHIAAGRIKPVAAFTERRLRVMPDVPTIHEQGIHAPIIANVRGILGPPDMPAAALRYWEDFFQRMASTPSWKKYVEENQVEDVFMRRAEMPRFFDEQIGVMRGVLREAGVTVAQ